jgi:hypothetical protein
MRGSTLFELRDELDRLLKERPGILSVGITKINKKLTFVVSIDPESYAGDAPKFFRGFDVKVRDLGIPLAQVGKG